ncbi:ATP-binding SpoIIE family protein phosphatase [Streptomyces sp. 142MFCol3.1]|uniref:ATP-binding SpoIIE family protein phosphatase n=1 Tax=Streptomyces sp. 142MFCol3.1 TaxID=1172179 RepID=UPI00041646F7|nr:ATP-binding SpoIIE family protein phosphatase [Streptomyces sp. 142MFCol3.1]
MTRVWDVPVHDSTRVRDVRVAAEAASGHAGLGQARTAVAALVATELATNLLKHAGGGQILIDTPVADLAVSGDEQGPALQIVALDHGPGMADLAAALRDGYSTTASLGAGLGTCRRVADSFGVHTVRGQGTVAVARVHAARGEQHPGRVPAAGSPVRAGGVNIPLRAAEHSGDAWACTRSGDFVTLLLADGLGHGPAAAEASDAAVRLLRQRAHLSPQDLLGELHGALRDTRGAAIAVARLDLAAGQLDFAGIGNVGARLGADGTWRPLLSHPGIVGAHRPARLPGSRTPWTSDSVLVLHSDGLPSRWAPPPAAALASMDPAVSAAVIVRDSSSAARPTRDDTTVAVLNPTSLDPQT